MSEQVDRYDVSCHCGAVDVRPKQDGHLVMYSDYAALGRELAETEARECHLSGEMLQLAGMLNKANAELARYSMCAGQADQFAAEAKAVRKALGFAEDSQDVAPVDLVDKITELMTKLAELEKQEPVAFYGDGAYYNTLKAALKDGCESATELYERPAPAINLAELLPDYLTDAMSKLELPGVSIGDKAIIGKALEVLRNIEEQSK